MKLLQPYEPVVPIQIFLAERGKFQSLPPCLPQGSLGWRISHLLSTQHMNQCCQGLSSQWISLPSGWRGSWVKFQWQCTTHPEWCSRLLRQKLNCTGSLLKSDLPWLCGLWKLEQVQKSLSGWERGVRAFASHCCEQSLILSIRLTTQLSHRECAWVQKEISIVWQGLQYGQATPFVTSHLFQGLVFKTHAPFFSAFSGWNYAPAIMCRQKVTWLSYYMA